MANINNKPTLVRVSLKCKKCPNPLFVKWIKEWIADAVEKDLTSRFSYRRALASLLKFPLKLPNGKSCAILQDFGPKLCARIDRRLAQHQVEQTSESTGPPKKSKKKISNGKLPTKDVVKAGPSTKTTVNPNAISDSDDDEPAVYGSTAPYTNHTAVPLYVPPILPATKRMSPPSSPIKPSAKRRASPPSSPVKKATNDEVLSQHMEDLILQPGCFEIILLVDNAELLSKAKGKESATRAELESLGVNHETRSLKVGDYAWVAREIGSDKELVLPYIVERKRVDDLAGSIMDGRYHEQKFRLKQCGVQNLVYLIESLGKGDLHVGLPLKTLQQASINTQIHGDFNVKHTSTHRMSMEYLAAMTKIIARTYKDKVLVQCRKESLSPSGPYDEIVSLMNFNEFNKAASKIRKWTVQEMFIKHLVQLRGMSVEKAIAVVERYPSPRALLAAYEAAGSAAPSLLSKLTVGKQGKTVGPTLSVAVHRLYTSNVLG